jgi:hypothetical protein
MDAWGIPGSDNGLNKGEFEHDSLYFVGNSKILAFWAQGRIS